MNSDYKCIGEYVGMTATVLLNKRDAHNYSVETRKGPTYVETQYFPMTIDERENLHAMEGKPGYEDLVHEVQTAIEHRANKYYNSQIKLAQ